MAQANRDKPPPPSQVKVLLARSGGQCGYRGCGRELSIDAPTVGDPAKPIGKIAHICAASEGGPRFDPSMTTKQRGSAANLFYLCSDHHDAVDTFIAEHPAELLLEMKAEHEEAVKRAMKFALGDVTYESLALVCTVVAAQSSTTEVGEIELSLPTQQKIDLNELGESSRQLIETGLAQSGRVQAFIAFQSGEVANFERRLVARMRADYEEGVASDLSSDELFDYVLGKAIAGAGPRDTSEVRAAALAVVALMFEICEIFERE